MNIEQKKRIIEDATKGLSPQEKQELTEDLIDYFAKREERIRRERSSGGFKPINFNEVLGHIRKP